MGQTLTTPPPFREDGYRLMIVDLDRSAKYDVLDHLHRHYQGSVSISMIGRRVQKLHFRGIIYTAWEVGGRDRIRPWFRRYFPETDALLYVINSHDPEQLPQARDDLHWTLHDDHLPNVPLLVLCNNDDMSKTSCCTTEHVIDAMGLRYSNVPFRAIACSAVTGEGLQEGLEWLSQVLRDRGPPRRERPRQPSVPSNVGKATPKVILSYDPTRDGGNITLQRFAPIQYGTECPFAKSAILWGGITLQGNCSLEDQARANADALTVFAKKSRQGERLDGFCVELDDGLARGGEHKDFAACVRRFLTALSDLDPAKEFLMRKNYIGRRGWRFRFAREDFFVTTFAPCYPVTSSRFAFNTGRAFVLLQPETSFLRHDLPPDTETTNWDQPQTVRDRTRIAYRKAGRGYHTSPRDPLAYHVVKPLVDDGTTIMRWWE